MALSDEILADGPAVYHPMQETSGTTATDSSGNSRDGAYVNGATVNDTTDPVSPLNTGKHVRLDGTDDHVLLNNATTWLTPATSGFTFECWIYPRSWSNSYRIFDFANSTNTGDMFFRYWSGGLNLYINGSEFTFTAPSTGTWHHLVATVSTAGAATVYLDGSLWTTGTVGALVNQARQYKYIGRSVYGADPYLPASVTQVAVYNKVLSAARVTAHYVASGGPSDSRLAAESVDAVVVAPSSALLGAESVDAVVSAPSSSRVAALTVQVIVPATDPTEVRPVDVKGTAFTGTSGAVTVTGIQANDLILLFIGGYQQSAGSYLPISALPTGFTLAGGTLSAPTLFVGSNGSGRTGFTVASKIADGTESTLTVTYPTSATTTQTRMLVAVAYRGYALKEVVDSSDTGGTASSPGTLAAPPGALGLTVGAESTNLTLGGIDDAVPDIGSRIYFYPRPYNSSGRPTIAIAQFQVAAGTTLPTTDWTWTGTMNGPAGVRGATTLLLGPPTVAPSSIASAEHVSSPVLQGSAQTVTPLGMGTAAAFGTATVTATAPSVRPTAIASAQAFGVATLAAGAPPDAVTADSPADYWRLDEASGSVAVNSVATARNGTVVGSLNRVTSPIGKAVQFKGTATDYISLPVGSWSTANQPYMSWECWFKLSQDRSKEHILFGGDTSTAATFTALRIRTDGTLRAFMATAVGAGVGLNTPSVVDDGAWHHVVLTFHSVAQRMRLYLDGSQVASTSTAIGAPSFPTQNWRAGYNIGLALTSSAAVDEIAVYTSELAVDRVLAHYNARQAVPSDVYAVAIPSAAAFGTATLRGQNQTVAPSAISGAQALGTPALARVTTTNLVGMLTTRVVLQAAPVLWAGKRVAGDLPISVAMNAMWTSTFAVQVSGGVTVPVRLAGFARTGAVTLPSPQGHLALSTGVSVPGDDYSAPIPIDISIPGSSTASLLGPTGTSQEPLPIDPAISQEDWELHGGGVWFEFTAPASGSAYFWLTADSGAALTLESWDIWQGDEVGNPVELLPGQFESGSSGVNMYVPVVAGQTYLLRTYSYGPYRAATVTLNWTGIGSAVVDYPLILTVYGMSPSGTSMWDQIAGTNVPYLYTTPSMLYLDVSNGPPAGDVEIALRPVGTFEDTVVGTILLGVNGEALKQSVLVPEVDAGRYQVTATDMALSGNRVIFDPLIIRYPPFPAAQRPSTPGDTVYPTLTATYKWQLHDTTPGEEDTFVFLVNPAEMGTIYEVDRFTSETTVLGRRLVWQKQAGVIEWNFSGRSMHKAQYEALHRFLAKDRPFWLTDHLARTFNVTFVNFDFRPDPTRPRYPWLGTYSMKALILDGPISL